MVRWAFGDTAAAWDFVLDHARGPKVDVHLFDGRVKNS